MSFRSSGSLRRSTDLSESDAQCKLIYERVNQFEHDFSNLSTQFVSYTRRCAKLRDTGDEISKILHNYASNLKYNESLATKLKLLAEQLSTVEDHRNAEVERLAAKVVKHLAEFGEECKIVKEDIRTTTAALKKESSQTKKLQKTKNHGSLEKLKTAETALEKATRESSHSEQQLHNHAINFEKKRLEGTKKILMDFLHTEILWHVKALEHYSSAFSTVQCIETDKDLESFHLALNIPYTGPMSGGGGTLISNQNRSLSQGSLYGSTGSLFGRPPPKQPAPPAASNNNTLTVSLNVPARPAPRQPPLPKNELISNHKNHQMNKANDISASEDESEEEEEEEEEDGSYETSEDETSMSLPPKLAKSVSQK